MKRRMLAVFFIVLCLLATGATACDHWECPADPDAPNCWARYGPDAWQYTYSMDCVIKHSCMPGAGCTHWCEYKTLCYEV
jgi:hypothetical protein